MLPSLQGADDGQPPRHSWPFETWPWAHASTHCFELELEALTTKNLAQDGWHVRTEERLEYAPEAHLAEQRPASEYGAAPGQDGRHCFELSLEAFRTKKVQDAWQRRVWVWPVTTEQAPVEHLTTHAPVSQYGVASGHEERHCFEFELDAFVMQISVHEETQVRLEPAARQAPDEHLATHAVESLNGAAEGQEERHSWALVTWPAWQESTHCFEFALEALVTKTFAQAPWQTKEPEALEQFPETQRAEQRPASEYGVAAGQDGRHWWEFELEAFRTKKTQDAWHTRVWVWPVSTEQEPEVHFSTHAPVSQQGVASGQSVMHCFEFWLEALVTNIPEQEETQIRSGLLTSQALDGQTSQQTRPSLQGADDGQPPRHSWPFETWPWAQASTHCFELQLEALATKNLAQDGWHVRTEERPEYAPEAHLAEQRPASEYGAAPGQDGRHCFELSLEAFRTKKVQDAWHTRVWVWPVTTWYAPVEHLTTHAPVSQYGVASGHEERHCFEFELDAFVMQISVHEETQVRLEPAARQAPDEHLATHAVESLNGAAEGQEERHSWALVTWPAWQESTHCFEFALEALVTKTFAQAPWQTKEPEALEQFPETQRAEQRPTSEYGAAAGQDGRHWWEFELEAFRTKKTQDAWHTRVWVWPVSDRIGAVRCTSPRTRGFRNKESRPQSVMHCFEFWLEYAGHEHPQSKKRRRGQL
ncbi:Hypothetical_protein [Hexamita inflata]|uniref:Hypothetical_protein n=1 Tax=Hexamita inflata TaxID=28002 RepID=A0AA86NTN7_9EUKA|nr:Hypothetical protein HINF_LOCUS13510 [Hexamita inflata]